MKLADRIRLLSLLSVFLICLAIWLGTGEIAQAAAPAGEWWDNNYSCRQKITINTGTTVLKSVQTGTATILDGAASATVTLSPAVDTTKSFLVFGVSENTNTPNNGQISGQITNSTTLTFQRVGTSLAITVKWYVAEFTSGVSVQRGSQLFTSSDTVINVPINSVNTAKTFPIITFRTGGVTYSSNDFVKAKITTSTNLELALAGTGDASNNNYVEWQVIEYTDANVQTGDVPFLTTDGSKTATVSSVNISKSWLIYTYNTQDGTGTNIGQKLVRGQITNSTTLTFDRNNTGQAIDLTWYLVEFTDGTTVQQGSTPFAVMSGSYTGDGSDNRAITGLGFRPDIVIIKGNAAFNGVIRTSTMIGDSSKQMVGTNNLEANLIQSLNADEFTVGSDSRVNGVGTVYYWVAFKANANIKLGTYAGNGGASQSIQGIGFSPEYVILLPGTIERAAHRSNQNPDSNSYPFGATAILANTITSLDADGFTVGLSANTSGVTYHYIVWNEVPGQMDVGSYLGNGVDDRDITGVGFQPEYVLVKNYYDPNTNPGFQKSASMPAGDNSINFAAGTMSTDRIQALQSDGFQVGTTAAVNTNLNTYFYAAFSTRTQIDVAIGAVNLNSSIAVGGYAMRGGQSPYNSDDNPGVGWFTLDLTSSTNLRITRGTDVSTADVGWFVIEFPAGSSANVSSGYSIPISFNHVSMVSSGQSQADGDDVRVVRWNGSSWDQLDRFRDLDTPWNSASTKIWFKTQAQIDAGNSDDNYYLYFCNPSATNPPANGNNVFFFYDGFESGDFSAWDNVLENPPEDDISIITLPNHTGTYAAQALVSGNNGSQACVENNFTGQTGFHTTVWAYLPSWSDAGDVSVVQYYTGGWGTQQGSLSIRAIDDPRKVFVWNNVAAQGYFGITQLNIGQWYRLEMKIKPHATAGRAELWVNGVREVNEYNRNTGSGNIDHNLVGVFWQPNANQTLYVDDSFDRLWVDPEPAAWLSPIEALFEYRKPVTISNSMTPASCTSNLSNFPLLINVTDTDLRTKGSGGKVYSSSGYDIIFRASDGVTQLDHEIETYDGTNGTLVAWVRIPTLSYNSDTVIYMYYGNAAITSATANPTGVWNTNNGWRGVWHLVDTSGNTQDSTSYNTSGTVSGTITRGATGQISGAFDCYTNGEVDWGDPADGHLDFGTSSFTVSAWLNIDGPVGAGAWPQVIWKGNASWGTGYALEYEDDTNNFYFTIEDGTTQWGWSSPPISFSDDTWTYIVGVVDRANNRLRIYKNGVEQGTGTDITTAGSVSNASNLAIGADGGWGWFDGLIDEVRIYSGVRDACWIGTEYNNQNSPGTFVTLGSEETPAPTLIKLKSFTASQYEEGVLLRWKTGYEVDNLGFHIYREENGQLVRLTPEPVAGSALLAGKGTSLTAGHSYVWWDVSSLSAISYQPSAIKYWLKDIDLNGKETMHGPVTVVFSREPVPEKFRPDLLSEIGWRLNERYHHYWKTRELKEKLALKRLEVRGSSRQRRDLRTGNKVPSRIGPTGLGGRAFYRKPDPAGIEVQKYLSGKSAVKILVREDGWYRVTQPELVAAGLSSKANPRYLQLYVDGSEQPIRVIGKGVKFDAIEFYGIGLETPSTDTRVYWLIEGLKPGKRIHENRGYSGSLGSLSSLSSLSFPYTIEKKERTIYFAALRNGDEENFFGPVVYMNQVDQILELQHLDRATSEDALLEVVIQGATDTPHRVRVLLNEAEVGEISFQGQSKGTLRVGIPQSMLEEGENLVSLVASGDEMDATLLDWIRLTYWHTYTADENALRFTAQGGNHLTVNGFGHSNIRVFDITDSNEVIEVIGKVRSQERSYSISFRVPENGERTLLALVEEKVKDPIDIVSNRPSRWHMEKGGYDLIIISHRDFTSSLQPLKKLRESQGFKVALIDVEDLYDEFSFGNKSPQALRDFLSLTKKQWSRPLRFVLLVGDASLDPRNYLGLGDMDYVPTKLIDTVYMETASDDWFVDLNNDGLPEMAIGRLPVQTPEEVAIVVSKIVGYEKSNTNKEALLVADRADDSDDFNFEGVSEEVRGLLPSSLMVRKIYRGQFSSDAQAKGELLNGINQGVLLVNFIGHGSVEHWRGGLLTLEDADSLTNGIRLPFFVNMTCLNGFFQNPYGEALAEALIKAPGGGAIAIWTSSGLTEPDKQAIMNKELIRLLFNGQSLTLGEATAKAKSSVSDQDIRRTWILFGDPTTRIK